MALGPAAILKHGVGGIAHGRAKPRQFGASFGHLDCFSAPTTSHFIFRFPCVAFRGGIHPPASAPSATLQGRKLQADDLETTACPDLALCNTSPSRHRCTAYSRLSSPADTSSQDGAVGMSGAALQQYGVIIQKVASQRRPLAPDPAACRAAASSPECTLISNCNARGVRTCQRGKRRRSACIEAVADGKVEHGCRVSDPWLAVCGSEQANGASYTLLIGGTVRGRPRLGIRPVVDRSVNNDGSCVIA
eukprot:scaffold25533_cov36-Tisochrysis_lutea.AAC.2